MGHYEKAEKMFIQNFWYINKNKTEIDPSPLVRRALLTPKILPSIEKAIEFQALFEKRLIDLIRLAEYGGATWSHDSSDLFKVDAGISTLEDIRKIPVRNQARTSCFFSREFPSLLTPDTLDHLVKATDRKSQ
jgi:hypothetical protein